MRRDEHDQHPAAHDKHAGHSVAMFRDKFWISMVLAVPTLVWGHMLADAFGYAPPHFSGSHWIAPVFGTAVFFYGGWPFLLGAFEELRARRPGMMTLIALAITVAFVFSVAVTAGFPGMPLWEEVATLVVIMLLGHWIEMRSISRAEGALKALAKLLPAKAIRLSGTHEEEVAVDDLASGDLVLIRPGTSVPADGVVRDGRSAVTESMITGESRPVDKDIGSSVIAGTINGTGSLTVEVTKVGEQTALAGIMRLVADAQTSRSRAQDLADRAAQLLTLVAVAAAVMTVIGWTAAGAEPAYTIERMVTVLVIACPHALGLAIPLVVAISTTLAAQNGLLIRDRRGLEEARHLDAVFFDKTGTLTRGEFRVVAHASVAGTADRDTLAIAAAIERHSEHSIALGIVRSSEEQKIELPAVTDFAALSGQGVTATVRGRSYAIGGPALLRGANAQLSANLATIATAAAERGQATVALLENNTPVAVFAVADAIRDESREAVDRLHAMGVEVIMMTGDAKAVAESVARELRIDKVFAEVLPADKASHIESVQREGKRVAMVGDGVNDAPALVTADVGVAIGAGTDVAVEAGDVILVRSDPRDVPRIIALSRATYRKMLQNLWWAAGYNIVAIPLAAGLFARWGLVLHPAAGAVLMSVSTIVVAINAQLLRRRTI
jgi:Cu2+-exporting ATPase